MKTALFTLDGKTQIVLTPETALDQAALVHLRECTDFKITNGSFYECRGGWHRFSEEQADDKSVIIAGEIKVAVIISPKP